MQPSRIRLKCRAPNRFTPSLALWQHFVASSPCFYQQQHHLSSVADRPQQASTNSAVGSTDFAERLGTVHSDVDSVIDEPRHASPKNSPPVKIRSVKVDKGEWIANKLEASIAKNIRLRQEWRRASLAEPGRLLAVAKTAYNAAEDYEGVIVRPMLHTQPMKEKQLPWCQPHDQQEGGSFERYFANITDACNGVLTIVSSGYRSRSINSTTLPHLRHSRRQLEIMSLNKCEVMLEKYFQSTSSNCLAQNGTVLLSPPQTSICAW